jgi:hypothetical protein
VITLHAAFPSFHQPLCAGKVTQISGTAQPHAQHAQLNLENEPANDTEPFSKQPLIKSLPTSSSQPHAQPFATPTSYPLEPSSGAQALGRLSRFNSHGSSSVGLPSPEPSVTSSGTMQRMGSSQVADAMNAGASVAAAGNGQVPFSTIDENQPIGSSVGGESGVETGGLSLSGGLAGAHSRTASIAGGLSARGASVSFGNLALEAHNQPERDYSTELLLRDAMYPATHPSMFPSLQLPELSMDACNPAYAAPQSTSDVPWSNSTMHLQAQSHQMAGLMQGGQLGGQMGSFSALPSGAGAQYSTGFNGGADSGALDYAGSNAESSAAAGGSSFFERMHAQQQHHLRQEAALRGWHAGSTAAMPGMDGSQAGTPLSPRHLQTGPAWDQMPGMWRNDGGISSGTMEGFDGGGGSNLMHHGGLAGSFGGMQDSLDASASFMRDGVSGLHSNIWLRGGSHPQLSTLGRGSGSGGYPGSLGGVGSMPKARSFCSCHVVLFCNN